MKLKSGKITILINRDGTTIEIIDSLANTTFVRIKLTAQQLAEALSRISHTECEIEVAGLDRVGKTHENTTLEFEIPADFSNYKKDSKITLSTLAQQNCPEGWVSDDYFSSQNTFFEKDGKKYARTTMRRYI